MQAMKSLVLVQQFRISLNNNFHCLPLEGRYLAYLSADNQNKSSIANFSEF